MSGDRMSPSTISTTSFDAGDAHGKLHGKAGLAFLGRAAGHGDHLGILERFGKQQAGTERVDRLHKDGMLVGQPV